VANLSKTVMNTIEVIERITIEVTINGQRYEREVEPRLLLVQLIREELGLTGTHIGCDTTYCGACTILLNGDPVKSCTVLAVQADQGEVLTVEGLEQNGELHPLQKAFTLHAGNADVFICLVIEQPGAESQGDSQRHCRESVQMHGLSQHLERD